MLTDQHKALCTQIRLNHRDSWLAVHMDRRRRLAERIPLLQQLAWAQKLKCLAARQQRCLMYILACQWEGSLSAVLTGSTSVYNVEDSNEH